MKTNKIYDRVYSKEQLNEYVKAGIPAVIEGVVEGWKAFKLWDLDYLKDVFKDREPFQFGPLTFTFAQFADALPFAAEFASQRSTHSPQLFLPQLGIGGNHGSAAATELAPDVEYPDLLDPANFDEVNFWIGQGTTPTHFDAYDNLLCVIRGQKFIRLYEPKWFPNMHVEWHQWSQAFALGADRSSFPGASDVPAPHEITLDEGEILYIPAFWFHEVSVPHRFAITLNYWYHQQQGIVSSGALPRVENLVKVLLDEVLDLNPIERKYIANRLVDVAQQLERRPDVKRRDISWSSRDVATNPYRF
jgi:Cupin-like domain